MQVKTILKMTFSATLMAMVLTISSQAVAKDLTHRLGIGIKNNTSNSLPSLAVVYYPEKGYAVTGGAGLDTRKGYNAFQINAGLRKMIYFETNLNFYLGGQLGMVSHENPASGKESGVEILGILGTEFFFSGLENLAFTVEGGLGLSTAGDTRFRTVADDPFRAGVIFYF